MGSDEIKDLIMSRILDTLVEAGVASTMDLKADKNRKDIYICEGCSLTKIVTWHPLNNSPHKVQTIYSTGEFTCEEQIDIFAYEQGFMNTFAVDYYLSRAYAETNARTTINKDRWSVDGPQMFSFQDIAVATDSTNCPMFDIEIKSWVKSFRKFKKLSVREHQFLADRMTLKEMLAFSVFYDHRYCGFALQMLCGPLKEGIGFETPSDRVHEASESSLAIAQKRKAVNALGVTEEALDKEIFRMFEGWNEYPI